MDRVIVNEEEYDLIGVSGKGLLKLPGNGINDFVFDSNCPQGYWVRYCVENEKLMIKQVVTCYDASDMEINGVKQEYIEPIEWEKELTPLEKVTYEMRGEIPKRYQIQEEFGGNFLFDNVNSLCEFSGKLFLGREFQVQYGQWRARAWMYHSVVMLEFQNGELRDSVDMSLYAKKFQGLYQDILSLNHTEPWVLKRRKEIRKLLDKWECEIRENELDMIWEYPAEYRNFSIEEKTSKISEYEMAELSEQKGMTNENMPPFLRRYEEKN